MRPIRLLLIYLTVVFLGGALLAPWLYALVQSSADLSPGLQSLAKNPFHRFVHRSLLALALIFLWPLFSKLGLRTWSNFGLANPLKNGRKILGGVLLGVGSLALIAILAILFGARKINLDLSADALGKIFLSAALVAAIVAVLEEILFRGGVFGALRKTIPWQSAMLFSSAIYAIVHFFSRPASSGQVHWFSGLALLAKMFSGFVEFKTLVPGFFTLLLAGMILALAYQRTGNLFFSMGLHAGWIFCLKSYRVITRDVAGANHWIFGTDKLIDGWLALPILGLVFWIFFRQPTPQTKSSLAAK